MKLYFSQDLEGEVLLRFKAEFDQDFEAKVWYRFEVVCLVVGISEELNPRVRCAFGNVLLIEAPIDIFQ